MIIIGYQGIGKSTIAGKNDIIDLESGNFWAEGKRPDNWYVCYCNIAEHLSKQGYIVFVSSHKVVYERLKKYSKEAIYAILPALSLRDAWIERLHTRYETTKLPKDFKAWQHAYLEFEEDICDLMHCGIKFYVINDMEYRLQDIIDYIVDFNSEWRKK